VSSVDSGNLAGALHTLHAGLLELKNQPILSPRVFTGLRDTLERASSSAIDRLQEKLQSPPPPNLAGNVGVAPGTQP
jgi:cyclic beta-1,2-glucan synthetase